MADNDRITKLESQIERLEAKQAELYEQLAQARVDQWKGRIEDLEVQAHLGAMDTSDRINAMIQRARDGWDEAESRFGGATSVATDFIDSVRDGFESAMKDIRQALLDAREQARKLASQPAKRAAAKKASPKKASAKKATAKKATAKRPAAKKAPAKASKRPAKKR